METNSFIINKIIVIFGVLNKYFEHSLIFKVCAYVGRISRTSVIVAFFRKCLCVPSKRDYVKGSILLSSFVSAFTFVFKLLMPVYRLLVKLNEKSVNRVFFMKAVSFVKGETAPAVLRGSIPYKMVKALASLEGLFSLFLAVMACTPHEYWNNMYIFLGAVFFAGFYALEYFSGKREGLNLKYIPASLMLYLFFCVVSLATGFGGMDSVRVFVILLGCVILSALMSNLIKSDKQLDNLVFLLTAAITASALLGLYRYMMGIEIKLEFVDLTKNQGLSRLYSVMSNPNNDAEFWAMVMPFSIAAALSTKCDIRRAILGGMVLICLGAFALTYSRSGYIALVGAAGVFILMTNPRFVPVCILLFIGVIPFMPSSIVNRLMTVGRDTSSTYRLYIWEGVIRVIQNYWVQGIGMGPTAFTTIYRGYAHNMARPAMHAHNVLLNTWTEVGIGGFVSLGLYIFGLFKASITTFLAGRTRLVKYYSAAAAASLTGFFIFSLVEYVWFYPRVMLCFWLVAGFTFALISNLHHKNANKKQVFQRCKLLTPRECAAHRRSRCKRSGALRRVALGYGAEPHLSIDGADEKEDEK